MADWTTPSAIHSKCGEYTGYEAVLAIDDVTSDTGTANTWLHYATCYHWIIFDMGVTKKITKIRIYQTLASYPTRWFGLTVGLYVYVGDDPDNLGDAVWEGVLNAAGWQESGTFDKNGRYIKLVSKADGNQQRITEFDAMAEGATLYLQNGTADEPKPNVKQSATSIVQWIASTLGGGQDSAAVIYPLNMKTTKGAAIDSIAESRVEEGEAHYAWFKAWISPKLDVDQTISGTLTVVFDTNEGNTAHNMMLRIKIYVWKGDDSGVRGVLYADANSPTESDITDGTKQTFFNAVSLSSVAALANDRIVIEVMSFDNNPNVTAYNHKISFADANTLSDSYIQFSQIITFTSGVVKEVTDSLSLSDAVLRDKTLSISDSVGLADVPLKNWTPQISDSIALLDSVLRNKAFQILDSVGLTDAILRNKTLPIADQISLADVLLANKQLLITDAVVLSDVILALKMLLITDTITLSDAVEVITGAIIKYVADTLGLSDAIKVNKVFAVSDTLNLLDQIFRHKPEVTITDAVALAEIIAVSKLFAITDSVSIADVVYAMKTLPIYDQITIADQISTPSRILQVMETVGLADNAYVNKTLIMTDNISLVEVVEVGKGVKKTKLFLIIGDLAIQLTGA